MKDLPLFNLESLNVNVGGKKPSFLSSLGVPGGWLVFFCGNAGISGVAFYPDPNCERDGGTEDGKASE